MRASRLFALLRPAVVKDDICDVNDSGAVPVSDALTVLRASVGIEAATEICCASGDCE